MPLLTAILAVLPAACSRRTLADDDAGGTGHFGVDSGSDGASADAAVDAGALDGIDLGADGGSIACGALTCTGTDLCVATNLCGGPANCQPPTDAGVCPPNSTSNRYCPSVGGYPGCTPNCPGPSYACVPRPATCTGALDCFCLGSSFCMFGGCASASDRSVLCANE